MRRFALSVGPEHYLVQARDFAEASEIASAALEHWRTTEFRWAAQRTPLWRKALDEGRVITIGRTNSTEFQQIE